MMTCQQVKAEHQAPACKILTFIYTRMDMGKITKDFIAGLLRTLGKHDARWVIVDRLTKDAHFLSVQIVNSLDKLAGLYASEIVRLHGVPLSILSDRDP